jgi:hypothetical protein
MQYMDDDQIRKVFHASFDLPNTGTALMDYISTHTGPETWKFLIQDTKELEYLLLNLSESPDCPPIPKVIRGIVCETSHCGLPAHASDYPGEYPA